MKQTSGMKGLLKHAVLIAGAVVFLLPLVWMLSTSFKVPREMGVNELAFFPRAPRVQPVSPFVDTAQFHESEPPVDVPAEVWRAAEPKLHTLIGEGLANWQRPESGPVDEEALATEMREGFLTLFRLRLTDEARGAAEARQREINSASEALEPEAISAGVDAILADAQLMLNDEIFHELFNDAYRRFCVGEVAVRTREFLTYSLREFGEWKVGEGNAVIPGIGDDTPGSQQVFYDLRKSDEFALEFEPQNMPFEAESLDRLYIAYRGDATWAFVQFEVIRAGTLYHTDAWMNLHERDWFTRELRWPEGATNIYERRLYRVLKPVGAARQGSPEFAIRLKVRKASAVEAWAAKLTRAYREAFREVPFGRYILTSTSLSILNIVLAIFSCTLVGYAFARLNWPGRDLCFGLLLATMMLPPQVTMIPQFLIIKSLGWYNTLMPLWIFSAFGTPFFIFLVRQFLKNVPGDLEDAARIDGCGSLRIYWHVMLPLIRPVMATIAIFTFMGTWNNFMQPLIYVNDERLFPLALGLFKLNVNAAQDVSLMMAGSFIMTLPIVALFVFLQRYFIQGISLTGTKA